jgi:hypothetical protein
MEADSFWLELSENALQVGQFFYLESVQMWVFFKCLPVTRVHAVLNTIYALACMNVFDLHMNKGGLHCGWAFRLEGDVRCAANYLLASKPSMRAEIHNMVKDKNGQTKLQYKIGPLRVFSLKKSTLVAVEQHTVVTKRLDNQE